MDDKRILELINKVNTEDREKDNYEELLEKQKHNIQKMKDSIGDNK